MLTRNPSEQIQRMSIAQYRGFWNPAALSFNGVANYVSIPDGSADLSGDFTLEMWVKPELNSTTNPRWFSLISGAQNLQVGQANSGSGHIPNGIYIRFGNAVKTSNYQFTPGVLMHVAFLITSSEKSIFVNGESVSLANVGINANCTFSAIGAGWDSIPASAFKGIIDEVRLWTVARTQEEIKANMNRRLTGNEPSLAVYWKFDEGTGSVANDSTINAKHGTISGASWVNGEAKLG